MKNKNIEKFLKKELYGLYEKDYMEVEFKDIGNTAIFRTISKVEKPEDAINNLLNRFYDIAHLDAVCEHFNDYVKAIDIMTVDRYCNSYHSIETFKELKDEIICDEFIDVPGERYEGKTEDELKDILTKEGWIIGALGGALHLDDDLVSDNVKRCA